MRFRKLRIAWSVVCGIAFLLLVALWLRSYWVIEGIGRGRQTQSETTSVAIFSDRGTLAFSRRTTPTDDRKVSVPDKWTYATMRPQFATRRKFFWLLTNKEFMVRFPTWLPAIFVALASVTPWMAINWKFTLRTLLIATTLLAIALAAIVLAAKK
jgi:hypothetical protein